MQRQCRSPVSVLHLLLHFPALLQNPPRIQLPDRRFQLRELNWSGFLVIMIRKCSALIFKSTQMLATSWVPLILSRDKLQARKNHLAWFHAQPQYSADTSTTLAGPVDGSSYTTDNLPLSNFPASQYPNHQHFASRE
ncbi:hypothetical protein C8J56DRAFT_497849 [Mycena floridula]|nr:hypothetical protein C8J56DRAFT_497849 [Mycena floridula]